MELRSLVWLGWGVRARTHSLTLRREWWVCLWMFVAPCIHFEVLAFVTMCPLLGKKSVPFSTLLEEKKSSNCGLFYLSIRAFK
jgi:hypothetical protein